MIPSHTKVAWAFLDKLLGRKPALAPQPPDPMTMTMGERNDLLSDITQKMALAMDLALEKFAKAFAKQVHRVAADYRLDARVFFHRLMQPRQQWPKLPPVTRRWLDVAASVSAAYGEVPPMPNQVSFSQTAESSIGTGFLELGRWVQAEMKQELEQAYLKILQREARNLIPVYTYPNQPVPTLPKVTLALMHEFEFRLEHAKLQVLSANLMERVFRLFT
jgi:hypothetical protein